MIRGSQNKYIEDNSADFSQGFNLNDITIVEEDFHQSEVAIENDNFERNFLKGECTHDWVFSFDADEMLVNAKD